MLTSSLICVHVLPSRFQASYCVHASQSNSIHSTRPSRPPESSPRAAHHALFPPSQATLHGLVSPSRHPAPANNGRSSALLLWLNTTCGTPCTSKTIEHKQSSSWASPALYQATICLCLRFWSCPAPGFGTPRLVLPGVPLNPCPSFATPCDSTSSTSSHAESVCCTTCNSTIGEAARCGLFLH